MADFRDRRTAVLSNSFRITTHNGTRSIIKLNVDIPNVSATLRLKRKRIMHRIEDQLLRNYNGKIVFANNVLFVLMTFVDEVIDEDRYTAELNGTRYEVILRFAGTIDGSEDLAAFYNKFFKEALRKLRYVQIGAKLFDPINYKPCGNCSLWPGYYMTFIKSQGRNCVTIDLTHKVIQNASVLESIDRLRVLDLSYQASLNIEFLNRCVITPYNKRLYRITGVDFSKSPESTFVNSEGETITFVEYYQGIYNQAIKHRSQPLLISKIRRGDDSFEVYLIPELCKFTGVTSANRAEVTKKTTIGPSQRLASTIQIVNEINTQPETRRILDDFQITLTSEPMSCTAEVIRTNSIVIEMARDLRINRSNGMFDSLVKNQMKVQGTIKKLGLLYLEQDYELVDIFVTSLKEQANFMSFPLGSTFYFSVENTSLEAWEAKVIEIVRNAEPSNFVLAFLPGAKKASPYYDGLKQMFLEMSTVGSQVVLTRTIAEMKSNKQRLDSICVKVLIQMNSKIGGTPWTVSNMLDCPMPTMIIGVEDLRQKSKGFLGIVSTINKRDLAAPYYSQIFPSYPIPEFETFVKQGILRAIRRFYDENNRTVPELVIIYSSSQERQSKTTLGQINNAAQQGAAEVESETGVRFRLVLIVVKRRTNSRFYNDRGSHENLQAGTVVKVNPPSTDPLKNPFRYKFFLLSLQSRLGVTIPCKYEVKINDAKIPQEITELLTYKQCYLYYNVSGPCKFPAPLYYAYKLVTMYSERSSKLGTTMKPHPSWDLHNFLYFI